MACCCFGEKNEEAKPLLDPNDSSKASQTADQEKKESKASKLEFVKVEVEEFDRVFTDFSRSLNPFVTDREKLEQAVAKFKAAVESLQAVRPHATFREYVQTLKAKLKDEGIFIKIKNGTVQAYGVTERFIKAVEDAVNAIKTIIAAFHALKDMPDIVASSSGRSVQDSQSVMEDMDIIIRREFSGIFDICKIIRFKKNVKNNVEKMKTAPQIVRDFCKEVKSIINDINDAFDEDKRSAAGEENENEDIVTKADSKDLATCNDGNENASANSEEKKKKKTKTLSARGEVNKKGSGKAVAKEQKEEDRKNKKTDKSKEKDKKKTEELHKKLKMETVGLTDIDRLFTDVLASLNKFITTREKMQQSRESFEKVVKTIGNFDGEKEFNEYVKELKEKAKEGKIHIYIDTSDGQVKLDSVQGVEPPAPYRNAVKALNDVKAAAKDTLDLEPGLERGLKDCGEDIVKIDPLKDFKKLVSGAKEVMALPKKVKAFNENRKKVQQAPQIVKEFCLYVKQLIVDITSAFDNSEAGKEDDNTGDNHGEDEEAKKEVDKEKGKDQQVVEAVVHVSGNSEHTKECTTIVC